MIQLHFSPKRATATIPSSSSSFPLINVKLVDVKISRVLVVLLCTFIFGNQSGNVVGESSSDGSRKGPYVSSHYSHDSHFGVGEHKQKVQSYSAKPQNLPVISSAAGETIQRDSSNVPEYIRSSLSSLCEKCNESQKKKVEQILLLLFNFNSQGEEASPVHEKTDRDDDDDDFIERIKQNVAAAADADGNKQENFFPADSIISLQRDVVKSEVDDNSKYRNRKKDPAAFYKKVKKASVLHHSNHHVKKKTFLEKTSSTITTKNTKFKVTSVPRNSPLVPTPEIQYYPGTGGGVIQLPTLSTTPSSSYSVFPHAAVSILPFYPSTASSLPARTLPFPASIISTTMSSALEPVPVEMPTPPMPPTTTGPIYLYYLSPSASSAATATISSSLQPPTTPVVESSVASKPTTIEP